MALLVGVPGCGDSELFEDLPVEAIRQDISRMRDVLLESGYQIEVLGVAPDEPKGETVVRTEASHGWCVRAIRDICGRVPEEGTLLIYFSGHGLRIGGRDYLVPSDATRSLSGPGPDPDSLLDMDLSKHVGHCKAKLVAFVVDACRSTSDETIDLAQLQGIPRLPNGVFRLAMGCDTGEVCGYNTRGSYFTRELTKGLSTRSSARTMAEVLAVARVGLRAVGQTPRLESTGAVDDIPICDSVTVFDSWQRAATDAALWSLTGPVPTDLPAALSQHIEAYAKVVNEIVQSIEIDDPWFDQTYSGRLLARMADVVPRPEGLTPVETALTVLAPFLREAVLALALFDVRDLDVRDVSRTFRAGLRGDLEMVYESFGHLTRRAGELEGEDADALVMWLVYSWLIGREDVWVRDDVLTWCRDAARSILNAAGRPAHPSAVEDAARVLHALARMAGASTDVTDLPASADEVCRTVPIGRLLALAGVLAVDPRRLSPVVAEHIGLRDPLPLAELRDVISNLRWAREKDRLHLAAACPHPAIHMGLVDVAAEAELLRSECTDLTDSLPGTITAQRLHPASSPAGMAYQKPLLRFRVAADKIQRLLMGSQLYEDENAAIRELYQNALDACRYRHMRFRFNYLTSPEDIPWQGRITFRQDTDDDGPYIDCEDNGVGMSLRVLEKAFAEAGTRFVHSDEFRREQARWHRADPELRLYPNSQFGIGVLSYFMLAREVTVWTVPTNHNGTVAGERYEVVISGEGSLFRIRPTQDVPSGIRNGGTVVRLHLAGKKAPDLAEVLSKRVMYAEYDVTAPGFRLTADELRMPEREAEVLRATPHVWWTDQQGAHLADGIVTLPKATRMLDWAFELDEDPRHPVHGVIVNFAGRHLPTLNVSRTAVLECDEDWLRSELDTAIEALVQWQALSVSWLWTMYAKDKRLALQITHRLAGERLRMRPRADSAVVTLRDVGCWPTDARLLQSSNAAFPPADDDWLLPWRYRCWELAGEVLLRETDGLPVPDSLTGYPNPLLNLPRRSDSVSPADLLQAVDEGQPDPWPALRPFILLGLDPRGARWVSEIDANVAHAARILYDTVTMGRVPLVDLLRLCTQFHVSPRELWSRTLDLSPPIRGFRTLETSSLGDFIPDITDVRLVGPEGYIYETVTSMSVERALLVAKAFGLPIHDIAARLARLGPAGVWSAFPVGWSGSVSFDVRDPVQRFVLELDHVPSIVDIAQLAIARDKPIAETCRSVQQVLDTTGLVVELPDLSTVPEEVPPIVVSRLLKGFNAPSQWVDRLLTLLDHVDRCRRDVAADVLAKATDVVAPHWQIPVRPSWPQILRILGSRHPMVPHGVRKWLLEHSDVTPELDEDTFDAAYQRARLAELVTTAKGLWRKPTALDLVRFVRSKGSVAEIVESLQWFKVLGADVPSWNDGLQDLKPDVYDLAMCEENVRFQRPFVPLPDDLVTPLHLVRVAGRFGWDLKRTYDRFVKLEPLGIRLAMDRDVVPGGIVHWQDLIVLTTSLDGWPPVLTGDVGDGEIERAAAAVGEEPPVTRQRLCRYATLFGLRVKENDGD
ncbi:caspase family protein [Kibdelosporangium aridum]|nr:caspase family protein [Kibdelosporangium aridum]